MKLFGSNRNEFAEVLKAIKQSKYSIYQDDRDVIELLSKCTIDDLIEQNGKLYFENNYKIHNCKGRSEFFKVLQSSKKYKRLFKSPLIQKAIELVHPKYELWFIGNSFSSTPGNYVIFVGELNLPFLFKELDYSNSLSPQIWRDIKAYREKGIIDLEYNEGILGTEVGSSNAIVENHWDFNLKENKGIYELEVVCDGIAVVLWKTELRKNEVNNMKTIGLKYLKEISEEFRYYRGKHENRRIK